MTPTKPKPLPPIERVIAFRQRRNGVQVTPDDVAATLAEVYRHVRREMRFQGVRPPLTDAELHSWLCEALNR
jgi:hypothetical protein